MITHRNQACENNEIFDIFYNQIALQKILDATDSQIKKALVTFAIEKALLDLGEPVFHKVTKMLKDEYDCYIPDCYEHPEYLKRVLSDLYGDAHAAILNSIKTSLRDFAYDDKIKKFLTVLH